MLKVFFNNLNKQSLLNYILHKDNFCNEWTTNFYSNHKMWVHLQTGLPDAKIQLNSSFLEIHIPIFLDRKKAINYNFLQCFLKLTLSPI